jgi:hypothetical protein
MSAGQGRASGTEDAERGNRRAPEARARYGCLALPAGGELSYCWW